MARYCTKCNRKFGFFEEEFEGMCRQCYEIKKEEEKEYQRKKEEERYQRKKEEKERKLKEQEKQRQRQEEIRKQQLQIQREKKEKEEQTITKIYEDIKKDLCSNIYLTYLYNSVFKMGFNNLEIQFKTKYNSVDKVIKYIINETIKKFTIKDFNTNNLLTIFRDKNFFLQVFEECIDYDVKYGYAGLPNEEWQPMSIRKWLCQDLNIEYINICINTLFKEDVFDREIGFSTLAFINKVEIIDFEGNLFTQLKVDKSYRYYSDEEQYEFTKYIIRNLSLYYYYACFILYSHIFARNLELLKKNKELYTMIDNLKHNNIGSVYIRDKIYPIYKLDYLNTFESTITDIQFLNILTLDDINIVYQISINNTMKEFEDLKNKEFTDMKSALTYIDVEKLNNILNADDTNLYIEVFVCYIWLNIIKDKNNYNQLLDIINNSTDIYTTIQEESKYIQARKDKERFLKGDFSKEKEMQKQQMEYSNVQNGYEFEEYVANLYRKLGYTIEEVTKKSGDQGADVIAYKDNIKYVIQVKFYNNPVGNKAVQEVVGAIGMYNANKGIVVTNSTFTPQAIELANANNIELVNGEKIEELKKIIIDSI